MTDFLEYEVRATDVTINEANGNYDHTKQIMENDPNMGRSIPRGYNSSSWVIRSEIGVLNVFGYNEMTCQFQADGRVFILSYIPTVRDVYYNVDIRCLGHWCQENGWKRPEPTPMVINERLDFWKHQWQTHVIDSEYMDKKFGKRHDENPEEAGKTEDDE